jgi:enamine deaminase RidA (YjgF/YER057c/UK114 family)
MRARILWTAALVAVVTVGADPAQAGAPRANETKYFFNLTPEGLPPANPFLANGVATGRAVATYYSSGLGPSGANTAAPSGTPARYIDYAVIQRLFPDFQPSEAERAAGLLPAGMTITEAQGLNNMARVQENLAAAGLSLRDVVYMRIYVDNVEGEARADYAGWNRAYRKYMANVDLRTGEVIPSFRPVLFENPTRPARANVEVATLPVAGWLIEIETVATYQIGACSPPFLCR